MFLRLPQVNLACTAGLLIVLVARPASAAPPQAIPDFAGVWARMTFGFERPKTGPGPIPKLPEDRHLGDYNDLILKPQAAELLKKRDTMVRSGNPFPNPSSECYPYSPPYILARNQEMQLVQKPDSVLILHVSDQGVRRVRLNQPHPACVKPSWYGDSVGRYEGDPLVVDTIGIKVTPLAMVDLFGTPYTKALHLVERYRLIDPETRKRDMTLAEKTNGHVDGANGDGIYTDPDYQGKGLQVRFTVDDPGVFTAPWSGAVKFSRAGGGGRARLCRKRPRIL